MAAVEIESEGALSLSDHNVRFRTQSKTILAAMFGLIVLLTSSMSFMGVKTWESLAENRNLQEMPKLDSNSVVQRDYFSALNNWGSDHQAFRTPLIAISSAIKLVGFGVADNRQVIVGNEGWFYYGMDSMRADFARSKPLSDAYLTKISVYLAELDAWSKANNIEVVFAVPPNKHNVYPENMPAGLQRGEGPGNAQRIDEFLVANLPDLAAPLHGPLTQAKNSGQVYYKIDTHWNAQGGFLAAQEIHQALAPQLGKSLAISAPYSQEQAEIGPGNFGRLMGLPLKESETVPTNSGVVALQRDTEMEVWAAGNFDEKPRVAMSYVGQNQNAPRALVLGDSFMNGMSKFVSERFSQTLWLNLWALENKPQIRFPLRLIWEYEPDVIVIELVERRLRECSTCLTTFHAALPTAVRQVRLTELFSAGQSWGNIDGSQFLTGEDGAFSFDLPKVLAPGQVLLARLSTPEEPTGKIWPNMQSKDIPAHLAQEQNRVFLNPRKQEYYMVLVPGENGKSVSLKFEGAENLLGYSFELREVDRAILLPSNLASFTGNSDHE